MTDLIDRDAAIAALAPMLRDMISRGKAADLIRALPAVTPAPTLAEALKLPEVKALVEAAKPYVSPVQNADYGRQLRQYEALVAALRRIAEARHD